MHKLRVGIVGCGNIFPMHAIPIISNTNLDLVAVCDNKLERVSRAAKEFQAKPFTNYETMIDEMNLDVVHICTPHYLHAPMSIYASTQGVHVLTEKPMSIDLKDAVNMIEVAEKNNTKLGVIFQNRFNRGAAFLKEQLTKGKLGKIKGAKCQVTWDRSDAYYQTSDWKGTWDKEGGGAVIDQAIHTLDLIRWFIDLPIEKIDANIANRAHQIIDVEDSAEGAIIFEGGVIANFHVINYFTQNSPITIDLDCEYGYVKYIDGLTEITYTDGKKEIVGPDPREKFSYGDVKSYWGVSHIKQINQFYDALINQRPLSIDGRDALITQKIVNGIYQSGKTHQKIDFKKL
jgi:UDP-N-acetyl-2-amino-2-deoxyglucuronate dehydrogenase